MKEANGLPIVTMETIRAWLSAGICVTVVRQVTNGYIVRVV